MIKFQIITVEPDDPKKKEILKDIFINPDSIVCITSLTKNAVRTSIRFGGMEVLANENINCVLEKIAGQRGVDRVETMFDKAIEAEK